MSEIFESTDRVRRIEHRELGYNIVEGETAITGPLTALTTGYNGYVNIDITALNLGIQVPEVSVVWRTFENLGGGVTRLGHYNAPFVIWNTNGTIQEAMTVKVYYDYVASPGVPQEGSSFLRITYYNRSSSNGIDAIFYKIKASDATS